MTQLNLKAIGVRCEEATPGPWWSEVGVIHAPAWWDGAEPGAACHPANCYERNGRDWHADAEFIACARTDVPALLAEIERLRSDVEKWKFSVIEQKLMAEAQWMIIHQLEKQRNETRTEVERLQRELYDERVWRDEWEKMYNQSTAGADGSGS